MFTVTFDGVEYTKASEVAKEFGYTADYIGQLCRAKKIDARLVGRTWFVNTATLHEHKQGRYKNLRTDSSGPKKEVVAKETEGSEAVPVTVKKTGLASKKYLRRVSAPNARMHKITTSIDQETGGIKNVSLHYEPDDHSLIPKVHSSPKITLLKVDIADSEPLPVKSSSKASVLAPEELPDVALSGKLSINEIPDEEYSNEEPKTEEDSEPAEVAEREVEETAADKKSSKRDNNENKVRIKKLEGDEAAEKEAASAPVDAVEERPTETGMKKPVRIKVEKAPAVAMTRKNSVKTAENGPKIDSEEIPVTNLDTRVEVVKISFRAPAVGLALGVVVATLVLSAEQVGFVTSEAADFAIKFDWSNVSNMALVLFTG